MENIKEGVLFLLEEIGNLKTKIKVSETESKQYREWWLKGSEEIKVLKESIEKLSNKEKQN